MQGMEYSNTSGCNYIPFELKNYITMGSRGTGGHGLFFGSKAKLVVLGKSIAEGWPAP